MRKLEPETPLQAIVRQKASWRATARSMTWEEKVRAIERMREAGRLARAGMRRTLEARQRP